MECPTAEVRQAFVRIIVFIAHFSLNDGQHAVPMVLQNQWQQEKSGTGSGAAVSPAISSQTGNPDVQQTLSDYLLQIVLSLLWMEVPEHGKHLSQYFSLFVMYASLGKVLRILGLVSVIERSLRIIIIQGVLFLIELFEKD